MQSYKYKIIYKPGQSNVADPLSRMISNKEGINDFNNDSEHYVNFILTHAQPKAIKLEEIAMETEKDGELQEVMIAIRRGKCPENAKAYQNFQQEICEKDGIILRGVRVARWH